MWAAAVTDPAEARSRLTELVRAATHRYATHGHGEETMLVHAATAPNAVLRTLPAAPRGPVGAEPARRLDGVGRGDACTRRTPRSPYVPPGRITPEEVVERALAHGDEHVIKLTDTAMDFGDERALAAALRAIELSEPLR